MVTSTLIIIIFRYVTISLYYFRAVRQEIIINSNELQDVMLRYAIHTLNANEALISNQRVDVEKNISLAEITNIHRLLDRVHVILMK